MCSISFADCSFLYTFYLLQFGTVCTCFFPSHLLSSVTCQLSFDSTTLAHYICWFRIHDACHVSFSVRHSSLLVCVTSGEHTSAQVKFGKQIKRLVDPSHLNHYVAYDVLKKAINVVAGALDSLRGSSVKIGAMQRRLAWPLRKDDTHKSRSVNNVVARASMLTYRFGSWCFSATAFASLDAKPTCRSSKAYRKLHRNHLSPATLECRVLQLWFAYRSS